MKAIAAAVVLSVTALNAAHAQTAAVSPDAKLIERAVDAFVNLCPIGVHEGGFEAVLQHAIASGAARSEGGFIVRSHDAWPLTRPVLWQGESLELAWGDDARLCGLIDVPISDEPAFNAAITVRLAVAGEERNGALMPGIVIMSQIGPIAAGAARHTVWTIVRNGERYEVVSVQIGRGPHRVTTYRDGVWSESVQDDRRHTVWLRRRPASLTE